MGKFFKLLVFLTPVAGGLLYYVILFNSDVSNEIELQKTEINRSHAEMDRVFFSDPFFNPGTDEERAARTKKLDDRISQADRKIDEINARKDESKSKMQSFETSLEKALSDESMDEMMSDFENDPMLKHFDERAKKNR